jgi:hypothetical protein
MSSKARVRNKDNVASSINGGPGRWRAGPPLRLHLQPSRRRFVVRSAGRCWLQRLCVLYLALALSLRAILEKRCSRSAPCKAASVDFFNAIGSKPEKTLRTGCRLSKESAQGVSLCLLSLVLFFLSL